MGKTETIEMMVEGGHAKADAAMSQKLGPMKINIQDVLAKINDKTKHFNGMKIPVKVHVDTETKDVELEVGTPPVTELIKNELNLKKGSGKPDKEKVGNMAIEQVIKVAQMKEDSLLDGSPKARVKSVAGSANSLGVLVEGKTGAAFNQAVEQGEYDHAIAEGKTEVNAEKQEQLQQQLTEIQAAIDKEQAKLAAKTKGKGKEEKKEEEKKDDDKKEEDKKDEKKPEAKKK